MANNVTIKPHTNQVKAQGLNRYITVTNNTTGTSVNLTQTNLEVIQITSPGPSGLSGTSGTSGTSGVSGAYITGSNIEGGIPLTVAGSDELSVQTNLTFDGEVLNVLGDVFVRGTLNASTKNFKIDHPTLPEYYLIHSSLEGPERGMYLRGKLETINTIILPDYWEKLTKVEDITVQLTSIGEPSQHYVKSINGREIVIGSNYNKIHCFYIINAQRYNEGEFNLLEPKNSKLL